MSERMYNHLMTRRETNHSITFHGTSAAFDDADIETQDGAFWDTTQPIGFPVLFTATSEEDAARYTEMGSGGCGSCDDSAGPRPRVLCIMVETPVAVLDGDKAVEDWTWAVEDGEDVPAAVELRNTFAAPDGTVVLTDDAVFRVV